LQLVVAQRQGQEAETAEEGGVVESIGGLEEFDHDGDHLE
jgi:hypothetical protein